MKLNLLLMILYIIEMIKINVCNIIYIYLDISLKKVKYKLWKNKVKKS